MQMWNYKFAKEVKGADVKAHEKAIIESKNLEWNYNFAKDVKGADVKAHGNVVIESKNLEWNYNFLDDALDEMINNEENKSMQKRF